ncbi:MAG: hypothetical protein OXF84_11230 [Bacteroidetes bacterium]|nr:hypothetical protein [Bacteroidota bacterium]
MYDFFFPSFLSILNMFSEIIDKQICPIWETPAKVYKPPGLLDGYYVESESVGFTYKVTGSLDNVLSGCQRPFSQEQKESLQSWLDQKFNKFLKVRFPSSLDTPCHLSWKLYSG